MASLILGAGSAYTLGLLITDLPVYSSWPSVLLTEFIAMLIDRLASVLPIYGAVQIVPLVALRAE